MELQEFIKKYEYSFFWINDIEQFDRLQDILIHAGFVCHTGKPEKIAYIKGVTRNLVTFKPRAPHHTPFFQRVDMYIPDSGYGVAVNYNIFINDYHSIKR